MKIGMEFRDTHIKNIDFTHIEEGNPGCGGTQYEFALLAHHLLRLNKGYEIVMFHVSDNIFEDGVIDVKVNCIDDIPQAAKDAQVDILLFWSTHEEVWYQKLEELRIRSVAWSHNFLSYREIKQLGRSSVVKAIVQVSKEQYELLCGEDIFERCTYIYNMFDFHPIIYDRKQVENDNIVCILGALIKPKGFHILAKQWKKILAEVPNAQLYVMGTGSLWNKDAKLGVFNLAESSYECKFMSYLVDENGSKLESVHFLGNVGIEKREIFRKCKVGVVNPTGVETFCIAAVEMEAEGVPVCSKGANGLLDTVRHNETGLLSRNGNKMRRDIIRLLKDNGLNGRMSRKGVEFAKTFSGDKIVLEWDKLFSEVMVDAFVCDKKVSLLSLSRAKVLRALVGKMKKFKVLSFVPSPYQLAEMKQTLKRFLVRIRDLAMKR